MNIKNLEANKTKKNQGGFSFIEILIVVAIMALLIAVAGPELLSRLDTAKTDQAKIQMKSLKSALELYRLDNSVFPSSDQGLQSLVSKPDLGVVPNNWRGPYLTSKNVPKDPWENDYYYQSDGGTFVIKSLGADREEGGEGLNADIELE